MCGDSDFNSSQEVGSFVCAIGTGRGLKARGRGRYSAARGKPALALQFSCSLLLPFLFVKCCKKVQTTGREENQGQRGRPQVRHEQVVLLGYWAGVVNNKVVCRPAAAARRHSFSSQFNLVSNSVIVILRK